MADPTQLDIEETILKYRSDIAQQEATIARQRAGIVSHKKAIETNAQNMAAAEQAIAKLVHDLELFIAAHGDPTESPTRN